LAEADLRKTATVAYAVHESKIGKRRQDARDFGHTHDRPEAHPTPVGHQRVANKNGAKRGHEGGEAQREEVGYDLITTFDAIHDQAKPAAVLEGIAEALRGDGVYLLQDIAGSSHLHNNMEHPLGPFLYAVSTIHCMTVSLAQGGEGLGTMWGEEKVLEMLEEAGFGEVEVKQLAHDFQNSYYVARKA
jgi:hypothetical protein